MGSTIVRHHKGSTKCRLLKLDFKYSGDQPCIGYRNAPSGEWLAIGWSSEGRAALSHAASDALGELESRSLIIRVPDNEQRQMIIKKHGSLSKNSLTVMLDSRGRRDSSFRNVLRKYTNNLPSSSPMTMRFDPTLLFSGAAQKAIERKMKELRQRQFAHHNCVSDTWSVATITLRDGFRIFNDKKLSYIRSIYESIIR